MSKVKASFSRKPITNGLKISGTVTRGNGTEGSAISELTVEDANKVLNAVITAIDSSDFDVETLDVTIG